MSDPSQLVINGPIDVWWIRLKTGAVIHLGAHGYSEESGEYVFTILMKGTPSFFVKILRIPVDAVEEIEGGWPDPALD